MHFIQRRVVMVTGKGGVGRTTVAVALARAAAQAGRRVLLTEVGDPEGGYSACARHFDNEPLTEHPRPLTDGLRGCHLWARAGHAGFLTSVLPAGRLIRAALRSRALDKFLVAAPSFHEMGVFYHLLMLLKAERADGSPEHELIVIDMPATGHTLALTGLPDILLRLIPGGPIAKAVREGQSYMNDPVRAEAWVVTLPEQLPVTESLELLQGLRETRVSTGGLVLNRFPEDPFTAEERAEVEVLLRTQPMHGEVAFHRVATAQTQVERIRATVDLPLLRLPECTDPNRTLPELLLRAMREAA